SFQILTVQLILGNAAVVFQGADGGNNDNRVGFQTGHPALDIQEFLRAQVRAEACLCDAVVAQPQGHSGSGYRVAAVSDISEGSAVDNGRNMLQSLYQVGLQGILQQRAHSAFRVKVSRGNRFLLRNFSVGISHYQPGQPGLQVRDIVGQAENRHDFGGNSNVVSVLSGSSVASAAQSVHYVPQLTVIHIHTSSPGDLSGVDVQLIALEDMIVDHSGQQVVGCS